MSTEREYTPRGCTRKPCAGCGEPGIRPINGVCGKCATAIKRGHEAVERERVAVEKLPYFAPRFSRLVWYRADTGRMPDPTQPTIRAVATAFAQLVENVAEIPVEHPHNVDIYKQRLFSDRNRYGGFDGGQYLRMTPATRDAIDALDQAISALVKVVYDTGKRDGAALLKALASGEITVASLNRQTIDAKE